MATRKHKIISKEKLDVDSWNIEQCKFRSLIDGFRHRLSDIRETIVALSIEIDASKVHQQLVESFYAYECHQAHFVFDRDMSYIIYSLGFVPVRFASRFSREKEKYFVMFSFG